MARQAAEAGSARLRLRILTSLVLAPLALAAVWYGTPYIEICAVAFTIGMAWEWSRLCNAGQFRADGWITVAMLVAIVSATILRHFEIALYFIPAGMVAAWFAGVLGGHRSPRLSAAAPLALGLAVLAYIWLRTGADNGLAAVVWLMGAVWSTDIAAYFVGRRIGGPRLAPKISPNKTWSGLAGGVACAALWGALWGLAPGEFSVWMLVALGAATAIVAQIGDLAVSALKRRFGVKDASGLIPGHGGVLDRIDGFLTTTPALACYVLVVKDGIWPTL